MERVQRAVGQGGFRTAEVGVGDARYRYVFDCGYMQGDARDRELRSYAEELDDAPINLLALSHLDTDHVNGVDTLLASRDAEVVLLSYLHPYERLALIVEACAGGSLTESRFDLLVHPARWFRQRGTGRVIQALPFGEDTPPPDGPPLPERPPSPEDVKQGRLLLHGSHAPTEHEQQEQPGLGTAKETEVVEPGNALVLSSGAGKSAVWLFVPFTHSPDPLHLKEFVKRACAVLGVRSFNPKSSAAFFKRLRKALRDK